MGRRVVSVNFASALKNTKGGRMKRRNTSIFFCLFLMIALSMISCTRKTDTETKTPLKIGAPIPRTGPYVANAVAFDRAITLAVEELNAKGGVLGRPLEIVYFDTVDIAPERVELAANTLNGEGVVSAHGGWSGAGADVRSFGKFKFPYFMNDCSLSSRSVMLENPAEYSNVFMMGDIEKSYAREYFDGMAAIEKDFGYEYPNKNIALIGAPDPWSQGIQNGIAEIAKDSGWNVVMKEVVPYGTTEWGPIMAKLRALKPAPAWMQVEIISPQEVVTFFRAFMKQPTNTLINYGYSGNSPEFMSIMGKEADGIIVASGMYLPISPPTKEGKEWLDKFVEKFGSTPSASMPSVYNGVHAWAQAVEAVGNVTDYDAINKYLASHTFEAIPGIPFSFAGGESDHIVEDPYSVMPQAQIQDGAFQTLYWKGKRYTDYQGTSAEFIVPRWINK
jgi:ABC-type branched-subunit amino acid transport system substrate-binding protein